MRSWCLKIRFSRANCSLIKTPVAPESNIAGVESVLFNPTSVTGTRKCGESESTAGTTHAEMESNGDGVSGLAAVEAGVSKPGRGAAALVRTLSKNPG